MSYADTTPAALTIALLLTRGCYQANVVRGVEALSGATLKGKARLYAGHYATSRAHLLTALRASGKLRVSERRMAHGKRVLVLRCAPGVRA